MAHKKHLALDVWHNNCYGSIKPTPVQSDTIVLHSYVSYFKAKEIDYSLNTYAMTVTPFGVSRGYSTRPALALKPSIGLVCKGLPNSIYFKLRIVSWCPTQTLTPARCGLLPCLDQLLLVLLIVRGDAACSDHWSNLLFGYFCLDTFGYFCLDTNLVSGVPSWGYTLTCCSLGSSLADVLRSDLCVPSSSRSSHPASYCSCLLPTFQNSYCCISPPWSTCSADLIPPIPIYSGRMTMYLCPVDLLLCLLLSVSAL